MNGIMDDIITHRGSENVHGLIDAIKEFGFKYVTKSGVTWSIDDIKVPAGKDALVDIAIKKSEAVTAEYNDGLLSEAEKTRKNVEIWQDTRGEIEKLVDQTLDKNSPVYDMVKSGARGSLGNLTRMVGMKVLSLTRRRSNRTSLLSHHSKKDLHRLNTSSLLTLCPKRYDRYRVEHSSSWLPYTTTLRSCSVSNGLEEDCGSKDGVAIHRVAEYLESQLHL